MNIIGRIAWLAGRASKMRYIVQSVCGRTAYIMPEGGGAVFPVDLCLLSW